MKKILTILSSLALISLATISVVACQQEQPEKTEPKSFVISLKDNENQNMTDNEVINNLIQQLNDFTGEKLEFKTDFTIDEIKRDSETQFLLAQKINVHAVNSLTKLKEDVELYLKRNFDYMYDWVDFKGSNEELGVEIKNKILTEINKWAPSAELKKDYTISENYPGLPPDGHWTIEFEKGSKFISGRTLTFIPEKFNLNAIKNGLTVDLDHYSTIEQILSKIQEEVSQFAPYAEATKDYSLKKIVTTESGDVVGQRSEIWHGKTAVDDIFGDVIGESRYLTGIASVYYKKNLTNIFAELLTSLGAVMETEDDSEYTWTGDSTQSALAKMQVEERIKHWVPSLQIEEDYSIRTHENYPLIPEGSWVIRFIGNSKGVIFDAKDITFRIVN